MTKRIIGIGSVVVLALAAGCAGETGVRLVVTSDILIPDDMDEVRVTIYPKGSGALDPADVQSRPFLLSGTGAELPITVGVLRGDTLDRWVMFHVEGLEGGRTIVERWAWESFVDGEIRTVTVMLENICAARVRPCDPGQHCDRGLCNAVETPPGWPIECGDGFPSLVAEGDGFEACDDGNTTPGDGCENDCTLTPTGRCGDLVVDPGEECDDGNTTPGDGCENDCQFSCDTAADCADDGNPCTVETCVVVTAGRRCQIVPNPGTFCNDGDACTHTDLCQGDATCAGTAYTCAPEQCEATSTCDGAGGCAVTYSPSGTPCNDGDVCTSPDTCDGAGACSGLPDPAACPCTTAADCAPFEDGLRCNGVYGCPEGVCVLGDPVTCPSNEDTDCTKNTCQESGDLCQMTNLALGTPCPNADYCDGAEVCDGAGVCSAPTIPCPIAGCIGGCDELNDQCAPADAGVVCRAAPDVCDREETCTGDATGCPADEPQPNTVVCRPAASGCDIAENCDGLSAICPVDVYQSVGTPCSDGLDCTDPDACDAVGNCVPGALTAGCLIAGACWADGVTNPTNPCQSCIVSASQTVWSPSPGTVMCRTAANDCDLAEYCTGTDTTCPGDLRKADTAPCDDSNACTVADTCLAGACVPGSARVCDDTNVCTTDSCDPATGCVFVNNTAPCDDGNACTVDDTCSAGACVPGAARVCDDTNVCTTDSCNPASGCVFVNNTTPCDDGNACTVDDTCSAGACVPGAARVCDDTNVCTTDSCNPATGCVFANNTVPCDDSNACTHSDQCTGGACAGTAGCAAPVVVQPDGRARFCTTAADCNAAISGTCTSAESRGTWTSPEWTVANAMTSCGGGTYWAYTTATALTTGTRYCYRFVGSDGVTTDWYSPSTGGDCGTGADYCDPPGETNCRFTP